MAFAHLPVHDLHLGPLTAMSASRFPLHRTVATSPALRKPPRVDLTLDVLERMLPGTTRAPARWLRAQMIAALDMIELQAGPHCRRVVNARRRIGAPPESISFYEKHARVDPHNGGDCIERVVAPLVGDHPGTGVSHRVRRPLALHGQYPLPGGCLAPGGRQRGRVWDCDREDAGVTAPEAGRNLQLWEPAGGTVVGEDIGSAESGQTTARGPGPVSGAILASESAPGGEVAATPTRASAAWTAAVGAVALLLLLAVFVGQNSRSSEINFLAWHRRAPMAALLLMAAVFGGALVAAAGVARILQLRRRRTGSESSAG